MSINTRFLRASAVLATALVAQGAGAQRQQGSWVFTPYVGAFVPANNLARLSGDVGDASAMLKVKHDAAFALGGTGSYWFSERTGLEVGGVYAFSQVGGSFRLADGGQSLAGSAGEGAYVMMGTTKLMYALLPTGGDRQLRFGIGPAIIHRGGTAYKEDDDGKFTGLTNVGAAMSLCTRLPLTGSLALRLRAEDYMYPARLKFRDATDPSSNFDFDRRFQNDFIFSVGLQIGINR